MSAVLTHAKMTPEEYLVWESAQETRNEYVDGEIFAMVGARVNHNLISLNTAVALRQHLRGKACRVFSTDLKLQVDTARGYFYPDIAVTCHPADIADGNALFIRHPWLIAEVLSDSTAAYDRGKKFEFYRQIGTLTHYLLVDTHRAHVDLFIKNLEGFWVLHPLCEADSVQVDAPRAFALPVLAMFEGVSFEPAPPLTPAA